MKATKKVVKEGDVKAILAFFIVALGFGIFLLFNTYKDNIIESGYFQLFMTLSFIVVGLLVGLLFLANKTPQLPKRRK